MQSKIVNSNLNFVENLNKEQLKNFTLIPSNIRLSEKLTSSEKLLYAHIYSLSKIKGYCFASNEYFAKFYKVTKRTICNRLKKLKDTENIEITYCGKKRHIKLLSIKDNSNYKIRSSQRYKSSRHKSNYFSIILKNIRYDDNLSYNEKIFYSEILSASSIAGYCSYTNNYFAKIFSKNPRTIQKWLSNLKQKKYIKICTINGVRSIICSDVINKIDEKSITNDGVEKLSHGDDKNDKVIHNGGRQNFHGGVTKLSQGGDKTFVHNKTSNKTFNKKEKYIKMLFKKRSYCKTNQDINQSSRFENLKPELKFKPNRKEIFYQERYTDKKNGFKNYLTDLINEYGIERVKSNAFLNDQLQENFEFVD